MERKASRYFDFGVSVKYALHKARLAAKAGQSQVPEIGKQLRRDAGNYLWKETAYNLALAVSMGGVMEIVSDPKIKHYAAGFFVLGAAIRETVAIINTGRLLKASFRYRRNRQYAYASTTGVLK